MLFVALVSDSVVRWQAKELRLKLLHAPESERGYLGEAGVQVVVGNHHDLHPSSQCRPHAVGSVFKYQALRKERKQNTVILSHKPIRSTGFYPCKLGKAEAKKQPQEQDCFNFHLRELTLLRVELFTSARRNIHLVYNLENVSP